MSEQDKDEAVCVNCEDGGCGHCENLEELTPASQALANAFDNPDDFDWGMTEEREEAGFANFGTTPEEAERLRQLEYDKVELPETD
jgi:hypothetical protein